MSAAPHICVVPGCATGDLEPHRAMCYRHWRRVPVPLQRTIIRLYANGLCRAGYAEALGNAILQANGGRHGR